ncbi:TlyA family RNA methyltransferase [bacterium]|nr:TlyA family RNA methyltransferase [bacterium]
MPTHARDSNPKKFRLDRALVERGFAPTRERAQAMILAGIVFVGGERADKAGREVSPDAAIEIRGDANPYVSRGGLKLEPALDHFGINANGLVILDVGISTGGFTDCLLARGAARAIGVDVGYGQVAWSLRSDPRVRLLERTNARTITPEAIGETVDLAVIDVSFISLRLVLPAVAACVKEDGRILALVKPQFEAGRGRVGSGGVVRDEAVRVDAIESVRRFARENLRLSDRGAFDSPVEGPKGNRECFVLWEKSPA